MRGVKKYAIPYQSLGVTRTPNRFAALKAKPA
nr:MAG TPA: hypothetical protein [Inoviridae sp.]